MRTKFNKDGTSVLQIDIESTKPTRGIYEVDEIEEFTVNEPTSPHDSNETNSSNGTNEFRQVIDINSVHTVKETSSGEETPQSAVTNTYVDKKFVKVEVNKKIGGDLKTAKRIENVVDDESDKSRITRINVDKHTNGHRKSTEIPEHLKTAVEQSERMQTLIIDDVDSRKPRLLNIDSQTHVYKNEVNINEQYQNKLDILNMTQKSVEELSKQLYELEQEKKMQKKEKFAEIVEKYGKNPTHLDLVDHATSETKVSHTIDIQTEEIPSLQRPVYDFSEERMYHSLNRPVYEDMTRHDAGLGNYRDKRINWKI